MNKIILEPELKEISNYVLDFVYKLIEGEFKLSLEHNKMFPFLLTAGSYTKDNIKLFGVMPFSIEGQADKELVSIIMQEAIKQEDVDFVVFIFESWFRILDKDKELDTTKSLADYKDSQEMLSFNILTKDIQAIMGNKIINKNPYSIEKGELIIPTSAQGTFIRKKILN